jgi:hypothetical protein
MDERVCSRCGVSYPKSFFRFNTSHTHVTYQRPVCRACEQQARDLEKKRDRWRSKAQATLRGHAQRLTRLGKHGAVTPEMLVSECGWDIARMAHEAEHVYDNGCPNCGEPFSEMGHGLADITLDITDRNARPVYGTNTRWLCMTCNRSKGIRSVAAVAELKMCWSRWKNRQQLLNVDPWAGTMFQTAA